MGNSFELNFSRDKRPVLTSCSFTPATSGGTKHSTQGKDFGWGKTANAVVAMAMCAVAYKAWQASGQPATTFQFVGETGSAAHTLRGSLLKDYLPAWFRKVFGERKVGTRHRSHGSQFFQSVRPPKSPNRKKGNRLSALTVDAENYPAEKIRILRDGKEVSGFAKLLELAQQIEKQGGWKTKINNLQPDQGNKHDGERKHSKAREAGANKKSEKAPIQSQQPFDLPRQQPVQDEAELDDPDVFDVPQFVDLANRASRKSELKDLLSAHPVVSVAGLSGSGKSFLVASFLNDHARFRNKRSVIWHDPDPSGDESLETLMAKLDQPMRLKGKSLLEKSKQLMRQLEINNQLLIIDDFQSVERRSYSTLIGAASKLKAPARLVLISQTNIGMTGDISDLPHLEVSGFDREELRRFLIKKHLGHLDESFITELLKKTEGLPIAADWFVHMITNLKRSPEQLLEGTMIISDRFKSWFNEITASLGEPALNTLHMLSLCNGPFNLGIVRMLCKQVGDGLFENVFESFQRAHLVQKYSKFRWRLHHLIVELCRHEMPEEFKKRTHRSLGIYHWDNSQGIARRFSEEQALLWRVRACQHLQKSGDFVRWSRAVQWTIPKLKSRGFYRLIIQLLGDEIEKNPSKDPWLAYNCAHSCLIIGRREQSLALIKPLLGRAMQDDPSLKISTVRLYADLLDATGKPRVALDKLQELLDSDDAELAHNRVIAQVKAVMVRLLTKLEEYCRAEKLSEELFNESKDDMGRAVALAGWGVVLKCTGRFEPADDKLGQAVKLFVGKDNRGYGWSLSHHAICQLMLGNADGASLMLGEALRVKSDIDEASEEYLTFLRKTQPLFQERLLANIIGAEIQRVSSQISSF